MSASSLLGDPNLKSDARHYGNLLLGVTWVETTLAISIFLCWTWTCWRITQRFRIDYFLGLAALVLSSVTQIALAISVAWATNHGNIDGFESLTEQRLLYIMEQTLRWGWIAHFVAIFATTLCKLCIIAFIDLTFRHRNRWFLWFLAATNIISAIITLALLLTECKPVDKLWNIFAAGECKRVKVAADFAIFAGSWASFSDFALALYPIHIIWRLQLEVRTRIGLCVLMGMGIIAAICAAIRTSQLTILVHPISTPYGASSLIVTTMTEQWITLIVACIAPSTPLFKSLLNKLRDSKIVSKVGGAGHAIGLVSKTGKGGEGPKKGTFINNQPQFVPRSRMQFHSMAYAMGTVNDYQMDHRTRSSRENMVQNDKTIVLTTEVEVQYEDENGRRDFLPMDRISAMGEGEEATTFDRV